jgi:hypothetical protein
MVYLTLNESNQIVTGTAENHMITTMEDCQWTVAYVEDGEIKIWGCADVNGLIDSTQFYHPEAGFGASSDMDEATIAATEPSAVNHLKGLGKKVYKDDVEL